MAQKNGVLTREDNRVSCICPRLTTTQDYCLTVTEGELPLNTTNQTWTFEVGEKSPAGRATPKPGSFLADIIKWLYYLGSGKIDDRLLDARHRMHDNVRAKGIGL